MKRICIVPNVSGVGGMVSFRARFKAGLVERGIEVSHNLGDTCDAILVIGGTRDVAGLWQAKKRGIRIVQRLDGMNWLHRKLNTGVKHFLRAEYGNLILQFVRARLADHIVYQSEFSRQWWEQVHGPTPVSTRVVYNGVDLSTFSPRTPGGQTQAPPSDRFRVLMVEGSLRGGYELGLESAVEMVEILNGRYRQDLGRPVELMVVGRVSQKIKEDWRQRTDIPLVWAGYVPLEKIPAIDGAAHLLYAADINAACPNSVIEALACGLPVLAFDTGALAELVSDAGGRIIPYGGDPWKLEPPDVPALAEAAVDIFLNQLYYCSTARKHAEAEFGLDKMVAGYLEALLC